MNILDPQPEIDVPGRSFFIATPCDDGHKLCFWDSLRAFERLYHKGEIPTRHSFTAICPTGDSLVPRARNNIAYAFHEKTDHDYLFQIDSDLDFAPADVIRLADLAVLNDFDILCGKYAIKQDELRWCINEIEGCGADPDTGLQKIAMAPGGLTIIHRRVFSKMIAEAKAWPHWRVEYTEDSTGRDGWDFYFNGVVLDLEWFPDKPRGRYLSEDWGFSYFARKLGFNIYLDTRTVFLHCGTCMYPKQARRMTAEEVARGEVANPDGTVQPMAKTEKV
jgi:hypothetical protein